jgi:ArsR family transcriptional regulator, nickel/cobalt-responsive transcriptional repressor
MDSKAKDCAALLRLLADQTRLTVLRQLLSGPKRVGEINAVLKIDQSLLSHHLKVLREHGLVQSQRDGKSVLYRLAPEFESSSTPGIDLGCCLVSFQTKEKS